MTRGELWTLAGGGDYTSKPRPVVVVQSDDAADLDSVTVCGLTTDSTEAALFRVNVLPNASNGLTAESVIMVDKITTVRRWRLGVRIGRLDQDELDRLGDALALFLGIERSPSSRSPR